jgi:hypothetical protein
MIIKDLFTKPIERDIQGVIIVGQDEESNVQQELEEYVVTNELEKHFRNFFSSYIKGISSQTTKIGVWISGFFGSGKSHFLKILSYILDNRETGGKKAIDYFSDKIQDSTILADMTKAAQQATDTDVILFNIDSKAKNSASSNREPIVSVFLRVFNELQGFSAANANIAKLEYDLNEAGKFDEFKKQFQESAGKTWEAGRNSFAFHQEKIVPILMSVNNMMESAARDLFKEAKTEIAIGKEEFARRVLEYLNKKGKNSRIVFMVDEMGQYIGQDTSFMLDLQTITEELGKTCKGRAWVIVTSQEDIDSITKNMAERSNDFSKIQGRFDTKLQLVSSDVAEVIRRRILEKTDTARQTLGVIYQQNDTALKNLVTFKDTAEMKTFTGGADFAADYPFIPYQFDHLRNVLTSIRENGASGKHLAQGERSMLALFKESAVRIDKEETGPLVPFNFFYDALDQFLDTDISVVVKNALQNHKINPSKEPDCFAVDVLKTLFLIKYVKEIPSNIENITSLMVSAMDEKRLALKQQIEDALAKLMAETLVSKKGENYIFLTNEEQAINREIGRQNITINDVRRELSLLIFDGILSESRYKYTVHNGRYTFPFTQKVDDYQHSTHDHPVTVQIITPYSGISKDDTSLHLHSSQTPGVVVILPERTDYLDEIRGYLQIDSYLRTGAAPNFQNAENIKNQKRDENSMKRENARRMLADILDEGRFFVNGTEIPATGGDFRNRIRTALETSIKAVYHKLSYIDTPTDTVSIRNLFSSSGVLIPGNANENADALDELFRFIENNFGKRQRTSMNNLQERFFKPPYGFVEADVEWLCAKLFKKGDILIFVNGQQISMQDKSADELVNYFTKKQYANSLLADVRQKANETQLKALREVIKELYNDSAQNTGEDELLKIFKTETETRIRELESFSNEYLYGKGLPGETVVKNGLTLLRLLLAHAGAPMTFFDELRTNKDELLNFAEDFRNIKSFFSGPQKEIFKAALVVSQSYDSNANFISPGIIPGIANSINEILLKDNPYQDIPKLPDLTNRYNEALAVEYAEKQGPVLKELENVKTRILNSVAGKTLPADFTEGIMRRLDGLESKVKGSSEPFMLPSFRTEAQNVLTSALADIKRLTGPKPQASDGNPEAGPVNPKERQEKQLSLKELFSNTEWRIESENDIDEFVRQIKQELMLRLEDDTTIKLEF